MKSRVGLLVSVLLVTAVGTAYAIRVSGPGQNTAANSLSVAIASDQRLVASPGVATKVAAVTPGSTDITSSCTDGVLVGEVGDGGLLVKPAGNSDASVQLQVIASQFIPLAVAKIVDGGTSVGAGLVCFSH